jgi:alpha-glucosidase
MTNADADWWRQAVVYQIYPRSFADANGDGTGDLTGIISRVGYLAGLGIDAVWLSPFYPSALADGGYDVDDYRDVDPVIGTLEQFGELVDALHANAIKLVVDIVPNHSSNRHPWFREALAAAPGSPERDRYMFRNGKGPDGSDPPSDWTSFFGGPAWTRVPDGQWYLHLFAAEQPDWNWQNAEVRDDFLKTLRFWGDRGVDGFRVDVAHLLAKDLPAVLPSRAELGLTSDSGAKSLYPPGQHPLWDRDELDEIYASWRTVFNSYTPPLTAVAEAWVPADRRVRYAKSSGLGQAFNFDLLVADWDPSQFRRVIRENLTLARESGASSTWVFANHDTVRLATRFGMPAGTTAADWLLAGADPRLENRALGLRRARAATLLALALPGSMYLYQGEELGLNEVTDIPDALKQDPVFFRSDGAQPGRDGCRVPLPWTRDGISFGFGEAAAHLPQPLWFAKYAVEAEEADPDSTLRLYRRALGLRHDLQAGEKFEWIEAGDTVLAFSRGGWASLTNFGSSSVPLPSDTVLLSSSQPLLFSSPVLRSSDSALPSDADSPGVLPADTTVWMRLAS